LFAAVIPEATMLISATPRTTTRLSTVAVALVLIWITAVVASPHSAAAATPTYPVMHTNEYPPDGVFFRTTADWNKTDRVAGLGVYVGDKVRLLCFANGTNVPRRDNGSNTVWYVAENVTRPKAPTGQLNSGWINAHFVDDGTRANQVAPGVQRCDANGKPPASVAPLPDGGSVYFQPRWSPGDPYPLDATKTIRKEQWSHGVTGTPKSKADCKTDRVDDNIPENVNNKRVTTMGTWSVARLAPIYLIEQNFELAKRFNFIVMYDPGSYANFFDKNGCDQFFNQSAALVKWLQASPQNTLMILAGHDTYDPNWRRQGSHQGIQKKPFSDTRIRSAELRDQVVVCNYNSMSHANVLKNFRDVMVKGRTTTCPRGVTPWHP
jgi:hypothetical protein